MPLTIIDPPFAATLAGMEHPVSIRNPDGALMGVFFPEGTVTEELRQSWERVYGVAVPTMLDGTTNPRPKV